MMRQTSMVRAVVRLLVDAAQGLQQAFGNSVLIPPGENQDLEPTLRYTALQRLAIRVRQRRVPSEVSGGRLRVLATTARLADKIR
jgi:hypothetical protein